LTGRSSTFFFHPAAAFFRFAIVRSSVVQYCGLPLATSCLGASSLPGGHPGESGDSEGDLPAWGISPGQATYFFSRISS
jgi:hypothetical protein